ncbi:MAG: glycosyl hydrolase [Patescibacteria group bacterium]
MRLPKMSSKSWLFLFLGVMVAAIPFTVIQLQQQQNLSQQAANNPQPLSVGAQSGLPWNSGAALEKSDIAGFEAWRGRKLDIYMTWPVRQNWDDIRNPDRVGQVSQYNGMPGLLQVGVAMLPENGSGDFAACATGAYDQYYKDLGSKLVQLNRGNAIINLGWEANGNWFPWSIGTGDPTNYKNCFRKQATAIKSTAPNVRISWNMNKESKMGTRSVVEAYPGDDVVDIVAVDYYDFFPSYKDQATWNAGYMQLQNGGPMGIGAWLQFAKCHSKPLGVPEWGINKGTGGGGSDNPYYIEKMYEFLLANSADIAFETYFNLQGSTFQIYPPGNNDKAAAKYKELWSKDVSTINPKPTATPQSNLFCASVTPPTTPSVTPPITTACPAGFEELGSFSGGPLVANGQPTEVTHTVTVPSSSLLSVSGFTKESGQGQFQEIKVTLNNTVLGESTDAGNANWTAVGPWQTTTAVAQGNATLLVEHRKRGTSGPEGVEYKLAVCAKQPNTPSPTVCPTLGPVKNVKIDCPNCP